MKPTVITFWTDEWYRERAEKLAASCEQFGLRCLSIQMPTTDSWVTNCAMKPRFIAGMLFTLRVPIIWIDADAEVKAEPTLLIDADCEFAVRMEPGHSSRKQHGRRERITLPKPWPVERGWFNSGTVYLSQGIGAYRLATAWVNEQKAKPRWYDQWTLQYAWAKVQPKTLFLPKTYCHIRQHRRTPAVIKHEFASHLRKVDRS